MTANGSLRPFRAGDLDYVLDLRQRVFGNLDERRERRRWAWEYDENPFADPRVPPTWIIEREGRAVGTYGLLPWRVALDGREVACSSGIDFAVEPELQGQGLGHLIAKAFMDPAFCEFPFITSPTPATSHLMAKYGGSILPSGDDPCVWVFPASGTPSAPEPGVALERPQSFDARFDELDARLRTRHRILTVRSAAYLNWRYRDYPFGRPDVIAASGPGGALRGFAVVQHDHALGQAHLPELSVPAEDAGAVRTLLAAATAQSVAAGHDLYLLDRDRSVHPLLFECGWQLLEQHPLQFVCRTPVGGPAAADWYLTSGDGDKLFSVGALPGA